MTFGQALDFPRAPFQNLSPLPVKAFQLTLFGFVFRYRSFCAPFFPPHEMLFTGSPYSLSHIDRRGVAHLLLGDVCSVFFIFSRNKFAVFLSTGSCTASQLASLFSGAQSSGVERLCGIVPRGSPSAHHRLAAYEGM